MFRKPKDTPSVPVLADRNDLERALTAFGLSADGAAKAASLGRHALYLVAADQKNAEIPFSRIGGAPDLPEGLNWPIRPGLAPSKEKTPKNLRERIV